MRRVGSSSTLISWAVTGSFSWKTVRGTGSFGGTFGNTGSSIGAFPLRFRATAAGAFGASIYSNGSGIYTSSPLELAHLRLFLDWLAVLAAPDGAGERLSR